MERLGDLAYNPVREHISIGFKQVKDEMQQLEAVLQDLRRKKFDATLSRVLIFTHSKRRAEEAVELLSGLAQTAGMSWSSQIDYFHAGLDGDDRARKYNAFKESGETVVLIATKAFGMGMDIKNIHYVYHLGPSSTFEDFLQEVGRAGRNKAALQQAGFSKETPIRTMCVMTSEDFADIRIRQHKSALTWSFVLSVQQHIHRFIKRYQELVPNPHEAITIPLDLLGEQDTAQGGNVATSFRLALHWLERLGRIRLGLYSPAFLPIVLLKSPEYTKIRNDGERQQMRYFVTRLAASRYLQNSVVTMPMEELKAAANRKHHSELFRFLFLAQKIKAISIERFLQIEVTQLRAAELQAWQPGAKGAVGELPMVEAVFALAEQLLEPTKAFTQRSVSGDELDYTIQEIAGRCFAPARIYWTVQRNKKDLSATAIAEAQAKDWQSKRAKFALKLVRLLPKMRLKSVMSIRDRSQPKATQLVYNGNANAKRWREPLAGLKKNLLALLAYVVKHKDKASFNYAELLVTLELEDAGVDYLDNLLFLSRALGYLKSSGSFMPMGMELFLLDLSVPNWEEKDSPDYQAHQEFVEGGQLKELRLLALECLASMTLENLEEQAQQHDRFIKQYFACDSSAALVKLLVEHLPKGEQNENLKAFWQVALVRAEEALNSEQRQVYDAPLDEHLQVVAGPGSGKTHTLALRVARLIQKDKVPPGKILVLAYNRAVVVELKDRLGRLFRQLGYSRLIKQLHVHTFHSLCKRVMGHELGTDKLDEWVPALIQALSVNPELLRQRLGSAISYAFVDEFQDITTERLALLQTIAPPERTKLCVIGDPNQSIYGYQKAKVGEPMDPHPYYVRFQEIYPHSTAHKLIKNYRSYPAILTAAEKLLIDNQSQFQIPSLQAQREPVPLSEYCEILDGADAAMASENEEVWHDKLAQLISETYEPGKDSLGKDRPAERYQQIAVMLRSNDEVFRAFKHLEKSNKLGGVALRVQGDDSSPLKSREFWELLAEFRQEPQNALSVDYLTDFDERKRAILKEYGKVWSSYLIHLVHCLLYEFQAESVEDATHQDLLDFIADMARQDDGHFARLYGKHIKAVAPELAKRREVVLTNMHKVKGLEFDAVLMPPSVMSFGLDRMQKRKTNLAEVVEEERRLLYVAYTRARYRLVVYRHSREVAVAKGVTYEPTSDEQQKLGRIIKPGIEKLFISWGAQEANVYAYSFIRNRVRVGDSVVLKRNGTKWLILCHDTVIGQLEKSMFVEEPHLRHITGLAVSEVSRYTLEESFAHDARKKQPSDFTVKNWGPTAMKNGYIYLVDFAGYYTE